MTSQINLRLPETLRRKAQKHVKEHGYRNIQELTMEALREKVYACAEQGYDTSFSPREVELIEQLIDVSLKGKLYPVEELKDIVEESRARKRHESSVSTRVHKTSTRRSGASRQSSR